MIPNISVELTLQDECDIFEHSTPKTQVTPSVDTGYKFDPLYIPGSGLKLEK